MKKLQHLSFILMISFINSSWNLNSYNHSQSSANPYLNLKYDKVIAYDYDGAGGQEIVKNGILNNRRMNRSVELNKNQLTKFHSIIGDKKTYGGSTAACFDPHMGFVYYLDEKIVGYISICLECNYLESSHKITATETKKMKLSDGEFYYLRGFSKKARIQLNNICKELNFSHCISNFNGMFD